MEVTHGEIHHTHLSLLLFFFFFFGIKITTVLSSAFGGGTLSVSAPNSLFRGKDLELILSSFPSLWKLFLYKSKKMFWSVHLCGMKGKTP